MLVDAVDQRPVEIEQEDGVDAHGGSSVALDIERDKRAQVRREREMSAVLPTDTDVRAAMREIGAAARRAARVIANAPAKQKTAALAAAALALRARSREILAANA